MYPPCVAALRATIAAARLTLSLFLYAELSPKSRARALKTCQEWRPSDIVNLQVTFARQGFGSRFCKTVHSPDFQVENRTQYKNSCMCSYTYTHILESVPAYVCTNVRIYRHEPRSRRASDAWRRAQSFGQMVHSHSIWCVSLQSAAVACLRVPSCRSVVGIGGELVVNLGHKPRRPAPTRCIARRCSTSRAILHPLPSRYSHAYAPFIHGTDTCHGVWGRGTFCGAPGEGSRRACWVALQYAA